MWGCTPPALCTLCIDVPKSQVVSPSGHDALTVRCKQEVTVPPDARCTARHAGGPREALTAPLCTSGADPGERAVEQSRQPAVQGDALHHRCSGSSTVPPPCAAGALDVPRLPARLRSRPWPRGCSRRHVWVDISGLGPHLKNPSTSWYAPQRALSSHAGPDVCRASRESILQAIHLCTF